MPAYGNTSDERLSTCHPDLQLIFRTVIKTYDNSILCGHRKKNAQNKAFDDGLSQARFPNSRHNVFPSMAVDVGPYFVDLRNTCWDDHKAFALFAGYVTEATLETKGVAHA